MKSFLKLCIFFFFLNAALFAQEDDDFSDFDLVRIGPARGYDTYFIGENWYQLKIARYITSFRINKFETTYNLWYSVLSQAEREGYFFGNPGQEGSKGIRGRRPTKEGKYQPVTAINWYDAIVWCNALSEQRGRKPCYTYNGEVLRDSTDPACDLAECDWDADGYRLPTEAEWEYAARKLSSGAYQPGDLASGLIEKTSSKQVNVGNSDVAWYDTNTDGTHTVGTAGTTKANAKAGTGRKNGMGLFDMSGNVMEYCWDWYDEDYEVVAKGERAVGPEYGFTRVSRGGSWNPYPGLAIAAARFKYDPNENYNYQGFRFCSSK